MARNIVNGNKRTKGYFFTITAIGDNRGYLLRNDDRPPELTFRDLLENTPFYGEETSQAQLDDVSGDIFNKSGLVSLSTDIQAKSREIKPSGRALAAQPSQLTSSIDVGNQEIGTADTPFIGEKIVEVVIDGSVSTRSEYKTGLTAVFIAWLVAKFDSMFSAIANNTADIATLNNTTIPSLQSQIDDIVNNQIPSAIEDSLPVGAYLDWPSDTLPAGGKFLFCDGSVLSTASYPELETIIGTSFGSAGAGTMLLPDCRGKLAAYVLSSNPVFNSINLSGGAETVILGTNHLPPHTHEAGANGATINITASGSHNHTIPQRNVDHKGGGTNGVQDGGGSRNTSSETHVHDQSSFTGVVGNGPGSSTPFNIMNPYLVVGHKLMKVKP